MRACARRVVGYGAFAVVSAAVIEPHFVGMVEADRLVALPAEGFSFADQAGFESVEPRGVQILLVGHPVACHSVIVP
jgi:hypothetical protein